MSPRAGIDSHLILKAVIEIADQQGANAVTISSVAKELGIRPPSLYNHVSGLDELKKMLALYALDQLYHCISDAVEGKEGETAIRDFAVSYISYAREHPGLYEAAQFAPSAEDREVSEASHRIVGLVLKLLQSYHLPEEQALHTVRGIRSLVHGFAALELQGGFRIPLDLQDSLEYNLNLIFKGLSHG
ncbi:Bacterial regulatory protein, tetR family [compost metagenome]